MNGFPTNTHSRYGCLQICFHKFIACVASVSVWFRSQERPVLAAREMKQEPKNESGVRGRARKETLADKPLDFENLRSPANAAPDWLG